MSARAIVGTLLVLGLVGIGRADEGKDARALLDRAIKAMGGEKVLAAEGSLAGKSKGNVVVNNVKMPASNEWTVQGTDRLKWTTEVTINDKPVNITLGLDRGKGWLQAGDAKAGDFPKDYLPAFVKAFAGLRLVETLLPLRDKGVKLSSLGEIKVDDKPAVGLKVARKGQPDLDLYFDKETNLPVEARMRLKDAGSGSEDVEYVGRFTDYKKIAGRMHFTKLKVERDGKVVVDMERSDIKVGEKLDDATFARP
jgi:hypothetical protein